MKMFKLVSHAYLLYNMAKDHLKPKGLGVRHVVVFMTFLFMIVNQSLKVNLSVAIVAMVNHGESIIYVS